MRQRHFYIEQGPDVLQAWAFRPSAALAMHPAPTPGTPAVPRQERTSQMLALPWPGQTQRLSRSGRLSVNKVSRVPGRMEVSVLRRLGGER